jgi:hypothetical protein
MINAKLQNIIDTKSAIGNAIVNKGGTITGETPFFNYAAQIDGISTGTPQTIFAASDGSKWARTNAVNLTNVSNNVTSDFNYWQPANNSTSDPILNIGTVGANISGNIRLVPVNQVNQAQYSNIVATDINGAKYEGFNGYDFVTNPTPNGNTTFNRWLLNNSATGTVIFANATFVNGGIYNGVNSSSNESNIAFIGNTASYGATIQGLDVNNAFIYAAGPTTRVVRKYHEGNLVVVGNSANFNGDISSVKVNNGFIYAGGEIGGYANGVVRKYNESTLSLVANTANYGGFVTNLNTNDGFIYVGGQGAVAGRVIRKYYESNLTLLANTNNYGGDIYGVVANNGFIYVVGTTDGSYANGSVHKYHEGNLAFVGNTSNYGSIIWTVAVNNGFIYAAGGGNATANRDIKRYHESNLVFDTNSARLGGEIDILQINKGFIYAGHGFGGNVVRKYYESNLGILQNSAGTNGQVNSIAINGGFFYVGVESNNTLQKYQESQIVPDNQTFYNITKIKE